VVWFDSLLTAGHSLSDVVTRRCNTTHAFKKNAAAVCVSFVFEMLPGHPFLDTIGACLQLAPVPYLGVAFAIFKSIWSTIDGIRWSKEQLLALAFCIAQLLQTLDRAYRSNRISLRTTSREIANLER
jgi:hypothetical protein